MELLMFLLLVLLVDLAALKWGADSRVGASDPYLNVGVARRFHELFPTSELFLLPGAYHYVQIDEPEQLAHLLLSTPRAA